LFFVLDLHDLLNKKANSLTGIIRASCLNLPNKNREHKSHVLWKLLNQLSGIAFRHILEVNPDARVLSRAATRCLILSGRFNADTVHVKYYF
jgi:hypothetical protein